MALILKIAILFLPISPWLSQPQAQTSKYLRQQAVGGATKACKKRTLAELQEAYEKGSALLTREPCEVKNFLSVAIKAAGLSQN